MVPEEGSVTAEIALGSTDVFKPRGPNAADEGTFDQDWEMIL